MILGMYSYNYVIPKNKEVNSVLENYILHVLIIHHLPLLENCTIKGSVLG